MATKISPFAGVAAAGVTAGAAGVWAWRRKSPIATPDRCGTWLLELVCAVQRAIVEAKRGSRAS